MPKITAMHSSQMSPNCLHPPRLVGVHRFGWLLRNATLTVCFAATTLLPPIWNCASTYFERKLKYSWVKWKIPDAWRCSNSSGNDCAFQYPVNIYTDTMVYYLVLFCGVCLGRHRTLSLQMAPSPSSQANLGAVRMLSARLFGA